MTWAWVVLWSLGAYAPQQAGSAPLEPAQEARVQALGKILRCAVCQGLSIADSPASMARAQLDKVRALVVQGQSDEEIKDYFVARYGEWVLLAPPAHGLNLLVWGLPAALLALGGALIVWLVRGKPPSSSPPAGALAGGGPPDPYVDAIRREVDE